MSSEEFINWGISQNLDPESPLNDTELTDFFSDAETKMGKNYTPKRGDAFEQAFENFYGDQFRTAKDAYEQIEQAKTTQEVEAILIPPKIAVGSRRARRIKMFHRDKSLELTREERLGTREEQFREIIGREGTEEEIRSFVRRGIIS